VTAIDRKSAREGISEFIGMAKAHQHRQSVRICPREMEQVGEAMLNLLNEVERLDEELLRARASHCTCVGVQPGTYDNQVTVTSLQGRPVGVDLCVLPDVVDLWRRGIHTIESCCGHGACAGYIAVEPRHDGQMLRLGYQRDTRTEAPAVFLWPRPAMALTGKAA